MMNVPPSANAMKQDIVGLYDRASQLYDQVGTRQFTYFGQLLIDSLNIPTGAKVLDVATGRGALLFPSAERVGTAGQVIGVDLAPKMVEQTSEDILRRGLQNTQVLLKDADSLDFPDAFFDFILCGFALHFLNYPLVLPNFRRMLKSNGTFAAITPYVPLGESLKPWLWLFELTRAAFPENFTPPAPWTAPNRLNDPEIFGAVLREAGFKDISMHREEAILYFADESDWWDWEWSQGSRFWIEGMTPEARERFRAESFKHLQSMKQAQGIPMRDGALFAVAR